MKQILLYLGLFGFVVWFIGFFILEHSQNKPDEVKVIKTTTTCRDTLVELETIKLIPKSTLNMDYEASSTMETQPVELFKDGKTRDTITKLTIQYY